jgi:hypothetical protein
MSTRASPSATTLRGRWLLLARAAWVIIATLALGLFLASIPGYVSTFSHLAKPIGWAPPSRHLPGWYSRLIYLVCWHPSRRPWRVPDPRRRPLLAEIVQKESRCGPGEDRVPGAVGC